MVKGLGLDIMLVSRMRDSLKTKGLLERIFSDTEREYLSTRTDIAQSAAGIFSAKEAVLKAMGKGLGDIPLKEIQVQHDVSGAPWAICQGQEFMLSITHMGDIAAAVALWQDL